jgi:hypothetical protein
MKASPVKFNFPSRIDMKGEYKAARVCLFWARRSVKRGKLRRLAHPMKPYSNGCYPLRPRNEAEEYDISS